MQRWGVLLIHKRCRILADFSIEPRQIPSTKEVDHMLGVYNLLTLKLTADATEDTFTDAHPEMCLSSIENTTWTPPPPLLLDPGKYNNISPSEWVFIGTTMSNLLLKTVSHHWDIQILPAAFKCWIMCLKITGSSTFFLNKLRFPPKVLRALFRSL